MNTLERYLNKIDTPEFFGVLKYCKKNSLFLGEGMQQ